MSPAGEESSRGAGGRCSLGKLLRQPARPGGAAGARALSPGAAALATEGVSNALVVSSGEGVWAMEEADAQMASEDGTLVRDMF